VVTLRVEDYVLIDRRATDSTRFILTPELGARVSSTRHRLIEKQTPVLGFFRSHLRSDPLVLSPEDRKFLNTEFRKALHIAFLIRAVEPRLGAFFVPGSDGVIPSGPALDEIRFDADEFDRLALQHRLSGATAMNDIPTDFAKGVKPSRHEGRPHRNKAARWVLLPSLGTAAALIILLLTAWAPTTADILLGRPQPRLTVARHDAGMLELRWNPKGRDLQKAESGTLTVRDGNAERRVRLKRFELTEGRIVYQHQSGSVQFTLALHLSDSADLVQTVSWNAQ
jgi:hypothetical protein